MAIRPVTIRSLGRVDYDICLAHMQRFTDTRDGASTDEFWFLEHPSVFTLGLNADFAHVLAAGDIPVVQVDRGGQVTYHGPGQLVVYTLLDIRRARIGIRDLVCGLENAVIATANEYGIEAEGRRDAPGVYTEGRKIASVGLRVRRGCSYHGLALNVAMDLNPFQRINPCGFENLEVVQLSSLGGPDDLVQVAEKLESHLISEFQLEVVSRSDGYPVP